MKAGAAGGIEAVVKVINTHINNAGVCEMGCGALLNTVSNNTSKILSFYVFCDQINQKTKKLPRS